MKDAADQSLRDMVFKKIGEFELDNLLAGTEFIKAIPDTDCIEFIFRKPKNGACVSLLVFGSDYFKVATWIPDHATGGRIYRP